MAALAHAGAIGAVFAGDRITLFVFWEMTAFESVLLVGAARGERAYRSGMRYLVAQVASGVILLAGVLLHLRASGSIAFGSFDLATPGACLILLVFGIKAVHTGMYRHHGSVGRDGADLADRQRAPLGDLIALRGVALVAYYR